MVARETNTQWTFEVARQGFINLRKTVEPFIEREDPYQKLLIESLGEDSYFSGCITPVYNTLINESYTELGPQIMKIIKKLDQNLRLLGEEGRFEVTTRKKKSIHEALDTLSDRYRQILILRGYAEGARVHTFEEIGEMQGVSKERIHQITKTALNHLGHPSKKLIEVVSPYF